MLTPLLLSIAFAGTKAFGPDRTAKALQTLGRIERWTPLRGRRLSPERIAQRVVRGYRFLPLPVECLDQALATWYLLNLKGYPGVLKIGMKLTPLQGHAWVEYGDDIYGGIPGLDDFQVVGEFEPWN